MSSNDDIICKIFSCYADAIPKRCSRDIRHRHQNMATEIDIFRENVRGQAENIYVYIFIALYIIYFFSFIFTAKIYNTRSYNI